MPKVTKIDDKTFEMTVLETVETTHRVTLSNDYHKELTFGNISKEKLVEESFKFHMNCESNTEILKEFTLEIIEQFFPEFPAKMRNRSYSNYGCHLKNGALRAQQTGSYVPRSESPWSFAKADKKGMSPKRTNAVLMSENANKLL